MKKIFVLLAMAGTLSACNDSGTSIKVDLDSLGDKLDTTAGKVWDSTKAKAKDIKEDIEDRLDNRDTAKKDTTKK